MARKKYSELEINAMEEAALNIKRLMRLRGLNQTELAEKTDIPTSTISDYANGRTLISMGNLEKIAQAFKVYKSEIIPSLGQTVDTFKNIPLIGTICAGNGLLADQNIEEYIHFPFPGKRQPDYALRVKGDSMIGAGIEDGDIVYMRDAEWADHNGQIVAVISNDSDQGSLKRIRWDEGTPVIKLVPENENFEVKEVLPNQISICGIYMGHFKPMRGE